MDKRAGYAQPIIDAFSIFVIIVLFLVFFALFSMTTKERTYKLKEQVSVVDGNVLAFDFLRMPMEYTDYKTAKTEKLTMAEALQRYDKKDPVMFTRQIKPAVMNYLESFYQNTGCPIRIVIDGQSQGPTKAPQKPCSDYTPYYQAKQVVPRPDGTMVEVEISAGVIAAK